MGSEAGHIQITEFNKEVIPSINYMMEDLFCQYGVSLPWFMCDFKFPDFSQRPDWVSGYNFNLDWGEWGYWLVKFNEMLGLLFDEAHLPRWQMPDLSPGSWAFFNDYTEILYDNMQRHYVYGQTGTFIKDEVIEGETSGITGWYKWIDGDGYIHVANKQDSSGEPVADFEEEKIVGADSGAYAWTYEAYTFYETYNPEDIDPRRVRRYGAICDPAGGRCLEAEEKYLNDPTYDTATLFPDEFYILLHCSFWWVAPGCPSSGNVAYAEKLYLNFDLSEASPNPTSAKIRVFCSYVTTWTYNTSLNVYSHDWGDEVDVDDWTGGALEDSVEFSEEDEGKWIELNVSLDSVNIGGNSKYRLGLKICEDGLFPEIFSGGWAINPGSITNIRLKLGYNE